VYFEPLPDIATQRRLREQHQANTLQLRPKVCPLSNLAKSNYICFNFC
jgi:hypothetical protein